MTGATVPAGVEGLPANPHTRRPERESNPRPLHCEADMLNIILHRWPPLEGLQMRPSFDIFFLHSHPSRAERYELLFLVFLRVTLPPSFTAVVGRPSFLFLGKDSLPVFFTALLGRSSYMASFGVSFTTSLVYFIVTLEMPSNGGLLRSFWGGFHASILHSHTWKAFIYGFYCCFL